MLLSNTTEEGIADLAVGFATCNTPIGTQALALNAWPGIHKAFGGAYIVVLPGNDAVYFHPYVPSEARKFSSEVYLVLCNDSRSDDTDLNGIWWGACFKNDTTDMAFYRTVEGAIEAIKTKSHSKSPMRPVFGNAK